MKCLLLFCVLFCLTEAPTFAQTAATNAPAPKAPGELRNTVIFIVRHAEKPETGMELTLAGTNRANAYTNYFRTFQFDGKPLHLETIFAAADSKNSHRPRLTLEPLSKSLGLPLDLRFKDKDPGLLADELRAQPHGKQILICWHHGAIPELLETLGADAAKLLPQSKWPDEVFSWVIQLRYDQDGHLVPAETKVISEDLMPGDVDAAKRLLAKQD
jgi:hypothetical protein